MATLRHADLDRILKVLLEIKETDQ